MTPALPLWRRILLEKRPAICFVGAVLGVDIALHLFVLYPYMVRNENNQLERLAVITEHESATRESQAINQMVQAKVEAEAQLDKFYREVLPQGLAGARVQSFARLTALAVRHDLIMERRSSSPIGLENSLLSRLDISMLLQGEYRDLRRFIYDVEVGDEFLVIEEVVLRRNGAASDGEVLDIGLSTYYRSEDDELE